MAIRKIVTQEIGTFSTLSTLAAGASQDVSTYTNLDSLSKIVAGVRGLFGATPEANIRLEAFAAPQSSATPDTVAWATLELDYSADTTVQDEMDINTGPAYLLLRVTNLDPNDAVTVCVFTIQTLDL